MGVYTKANFQTLIDVICETYDFEVDYIHTELICELIYAHEMPMFRLLFLEGEGSIVISFHVAISKADAFDILAFVREQMPQVVIGNEYLVNDEGQTLSGHDAYIELERQIQQNANPLVQEDFEYAPDSPITLSVQQSIFHALDPRAQEQKEITERKNRYNGRFTWEDLDD